MTDTPADHRLISRQLGPDHRVIAIVRTGGEADDMTDDEILDSMVKWGEQQRHLRAVDDA
ncbi:hypothetical protein [Streptomyces sp. NPDC004008]